MNKLLLSLLFCFCIKVAIAQVTFEPGYFIDNNGNRIECLIKNTDRSNNPIQFEYKLSENSNVLLGSLENVTEFEIFNTRHKYERHTIDIDLATNNTKDLSYTREPEFTQKQLFLRVLINGPVSLYAYSTLGGLQRFFYKIDSIPPKQLVYRRYLVSEEVIRHNNTFRQQLWSSLKCSSFTLEQFNNIDYTEKDLVMVNVKYNECVGAAYINYASRKPKGKLVLTGKAGVNHASGKAELNLYVDSYENNEIVKRTHSRYYSIASKTSPQIGLEIEYIFPYNKRKWSMFFEPSFQHHKYSVDVTIDKARSRGYPYPFLEVKTKFDINVSRFVMPSGVKYNLFITESSNLFFKGGLAFNLIISPAESLSLENLEVRPPGNVKEADIQFGLTSGVGYRFKNRFNLEMQYQLKNETIVKPNVTVDRLYPLINEFRIYNPLSVVIGYRIY